MTEGGVGRGVPAGPGAGVARCLQVDVAEEEVEVVSGLLWAAGVSGVAEVALGGGRVRLVAGLEAADEAAAVAALAPRPVDCFDGDHDGWLDAWRPFARPVRVGRVVVHPTWEPPPWPTLPTATDDLLVALDPGRSFGSGSHATTRLVLAALQREPLEGLRVLDVGCGSGVLSVVAARLGAARVVAADVDPGAVQATAENAARNGVADRVTATATPVGQVSGPFDLVLANILAPVLADLAPDVSGQVAPSGRLLLSGLHEDQAPGVLRAYRSVDQRWVEVARTGEDPWVQLTLARSPA